MSESRENRSADRTIAILEAFEEKRRPLTLRELATCCDIPASTCHALVQTLINRAYLYQSSRRKDLYPTRRILDLARTVVEHDPFLERMAPVLEQLRLETQETVILGKRHKDQILYLEVLESPQTIRYSSRAGEFKPLHSSSIGKVMLAALNSIELEEWLRARILPRVTGNTLTSRARLIEDLAECRRRGYFTTRGENVLDVTAIAVPALVNAELLGIAVAGPSHRMAPNHEKHAARLLLAQRRLQKEGIAA
ncbi:MAG: IclR family transcriptional regulator [Gammaproteobacteria bacterium]|nr:MAG: IclR family transcriptional regulator [Gammaproteobacteria bacterium]